MAEGILPLNADLYQISTPINEAKALIFFEIRPTSLGEVRRRQPIIAFFNRMFLAVIY